MQSKQLRNDRGSALISAAVTAAVLSILVAGFVSYMANEYLLNLRSHNYNQALHLAEAALETGFGQFKYQGGQFQSAPSGWSGSGSGPYTKTVTNFTDATGRVVGSFTVTVNGVGAANPQIQGVGTANAARGPSSVSRAVLVKLATSSTFPVGLMSRNVINLNGNNAYTDSFDSGDPAKSTGGVYDAAKRQPHGDVATDSTLTDSIGIGNADIYGTAATGPSGTVTMGPNGSVGPTFTSGERATTVAAGVAAGWIRSDFNVDVPDPTPPSGASSWPAPAIGASINNSGTISTGDFKVSDISLAGNKALTISGNVKLYVTGSTGISGNATVVVLPGASLTVYAAGSISISGNGVQNDATYAVKNIWYGLSTCTSVSVSGNGSFTGAIYAPEADLSVSGNGNLYGAVVAKSVTLGGNANFHYDEALKGFYSPTGYVVASWQELRYIGGSWVP
jgi:hypothetical protein